MSSNLNLEKKLQDCAIKHNNKYDYSLVKYVNFRTRVKIICPIHGEFTQRLGAHGLGKGCEPCGHIKKGRDKSNKVGVSFVDECMKIHPHYNYNKVVYINRVEKVIITCGCHGDFKVSPYAFLRSVIGCPECSRLVMVALNKKEVFGWTKEVWKAKGEKSKTFDSFKAYVIKCWKDDEVFYKIGKTFNKLRKRFSCDEDLPYKFEAVHIFEFENAFDAHDKEIELKELNAKNKYVPKLKFAGMNECFKSVVVS